MKPIVCDTSPLNYLVQLGRVNLLPELYSSILVPVEVISELQHPKAPVLVRNWVADVPSWVNIWRVQNKLSLAADEGEVAALSVAVESKNQTILMDDARGRDLAVMLGLAPIGTLRLLELGWETGLIDLETELRKLEQLNFRAHPALFAQLRAKIRGG